MTLSLARLGLMGGIGSGNLKLIETQTASNVNTLDFTSIQESTYNVHFVTLNNISANSSGYPDTSQVRLRVSDDGGSSYKSGGSDYQYAFQFVKTNGTEGDRNDSANTDMLLTGRATNTNEVVNSYVYLYNLGDSTKYSLATHHQSIASDEETMFGGQAYTTASTINAIRFFISGFTMSGNISLYGVEFA